MATTPPFMQLHVRVYRREDYFVAHCVELDLVECAETAEVAFARAQRVCVAQVAYALQLESDGVEGAMASIFKPYDPVLYGSIVSAFARGELTLGIEMLDVPGARRPVAISGVMADAA